MIVKLGENVSFSINFCHSFRLEWNCCIQHFKCIRRDRCATLWWENAWPMFPQLHTQNSQLLIKVSCYNFSYTLCFSRQAHSLAWFYFVCCWNMCDAAGLDRSDVIPLCLSCQEGWFGVDSSWLILRFLIFACHLFKVFSPSECRLLQAASVKFCAACASIWVLWSLAPPQLPKRFHWNLHSL